VTAKLARGARVVGSLVALALMVAVVVRGASAVDLSTVSWAWALASVALFAVSWVTFSLAWVSLCGERIRIGGMARWVHSQLLRYLPGAIWAPMARASSVDGRRRRQVATLAVEFMVLATMAAAVGGIAGAFAVSPWLAGLVVLPCGLVAAVRWLGARVDVDVRHVVAAMGWLLVGWPIYGFASIAAQSAVGPGLGAAQIVAASLLAWTVGFVAVFAPGGAGVREAVYATVLGTSSLHGVAAAGAVVSRVTFTIAEVVVAGLLAAVARRQVNAPDRRDGWWRPRRSTGSTDPPSMK
jgi:hypothetical protein